MRPRTAAIALVIASLVYLVLDAQAPPQRILSSRAGPGEPGEIALFVANADGTAEQPLSPSKSFDYNAA